jgi:thiol-disulfide isomerase/thioredoxin
MKKMTLQGVRGLLAVATLSLLAACGPKRSEFTLHGTIDAPDGTLIYLSAQIDDSSMVDSTVIQGGKFTFSGYLDQPMAAMLYMGDCMDMHNTRRCPLFLDPTEMTVQVSVDDFGHARLTGSKTQQDSERLDSLTAPYLAQISALRDSVNFHAGDEEVVKSFNLQFDSIQGLISETQKSFLQQNSSSTYAPFLLSALMNSMSYDELKGAYESLAPEVQPQASKVKEELDILAALQPGQPAPEIQGVNPEGQSIKLSDLKGKVVLIDFWATWCGPCRRSFPHVRALYQKYHDQGLEVFCVGDDDREVEKWKQVIVSDSLQDFHHVLRGLKYIMKNGRFSGFDTTTDQDKAYAIHYIPSKFLVGRDGCLYGRFDEEDELDSKLQEIFGE